MVDIKSPASDLAGKSQNPMDEGSPGIYNGEPGYKGRTPSPNAAPEKLYDGVSVKDSPSIKTPSDRTDERLKSAE